MTFPSNPGPSDPERYRVRSSVCRNFVVSPLNILI